MDHSLLLSIFPLADRPNSMPLFDDTLLAVSSFITFEALSPSLHSFIYVFTESFTSSCLLVIHAEMQNYRVHLECFRTTRSCLGKQ